MFFLQLFHDNLITKSLSEHDFDQHEVGIDLEVDRPAETLEEVRASL